METKGKTLATKEWERAEDLSIREMECHMDMDMFLDGYVRWKEGSPHQPIILHEMFLHATVQGQKEAE